MKTDQIQKFLFEEKDIRGAYVSLTSTYQENNKSHHYPDFVDRLLAEFLCACVLLSSSLKFEGRLVLQIRSEGDITLLMAESDHRQNVRAIAKFSENVRFSDFEAAFTKGTFAMTIEPAGRKPYQGIVPLSGSCLADCLAEYFVRSEQLGTHLFFALEDDCAAGFFIQQMPSHRVMDKALRKKQWMEVKMFVETLSAQELTTLACENLLHRLFSEDEIRIFDASEVQFSCRCSKARMDSALISLGKQELEKMLAEQDDIEMKCEFCNTAYCYDQKAIFTLLEDDANMDG